MKDRKCQKCLSVSRGKLIRVVCAKVVEEKPRLVDTGMYSAMYYDRTYRYEFAENVFICISCLRTNKHRWCAGAILSFVVVIMSFAMPMQESAQTIAGEPLVVSASRFAGAFGGTFVALLALSRIAGFIGKGLDNELAMLFLRADMSKHEVDAGARVEYFTRTDWDNIRRSGTTRVDPEDDFHFALIVLGTFVLPFAISIVFKLFSLANWALL